MTATPSQSAISLPVLLRRFKWRIGVTMGLVVIEAVLMLLIPLFLGFAINGLLEDDVTGIAAFGFLLLLLLAVGAGRRFYDTRAYSGIYAVISTEMVERERARGTSASATAVRATLLVEFVEFLENSMPAIVSSFIGIGGVLVIIAGLDFTVFLACLGVLLLMGGVYWATQGRNLRLNRGYNDQLEHQVHAVSALSIGGVKRHFEGLMRWNVRLSDLETVNFSVAFLGIIALYLYAPIKLVTGSVAYGFVFSALMYVFQFVEDLMAMPLYIQQLIRLQEITRRLAVEPGEDASPPSPAIEGSVA